jgi:hypothetical protein
MGGRASKQKGYRGEIAVRDHLRELGWEADRVPGSGAYTKKDGDGYSGDVKASKDGRESLFEVKCRATGFESVYTLRQILNNGYDAQGFVLDGQIALIGLTPESVGGGLATPLHKLLGRHPWALKTARKIINMQKWLKGADYLVIKSDRMPLLYLRFPFYEKTSTLS